MSMELELTVRQQILLGSRRLYDRGMLAAADGNLSYRLSDERIVITPSGVAKAFIKAEDLCIIDLQGRILEGKPSGEMSMHLEVYRQVKKAKAVVHAHPPYAVAWSISHPQLSELPSDCLSEIILAVGSIPIVPYARPTTVGMGEVLGSFLPHHRLMILSRHGGLSWGEDLDEAVNGMERLEHSAQILALAKQMGGLSFLPTEEVEALREMRRGIGERTL